MFVDIPSGAINSINTTYTLAHTPIVSSFTLYRNGLAQDPGIDYTLTGNTIVFTLPPQTTDWLQAVYDFFPGGGPGPMMFSGCGYKQYTMGRFVQEISALLADPLNIFWAVQEVRFAVTEALREWSATTSYWRARGAFSINRPNLTFPPIYFYDLSQTLPLLRPRTVTIDSIVREIQFHLYEPSTGVLGAGMSPQFSVLKIIQAVIRARNRFALDTQLPITINEMVPVSSPPAGRLCLDQRVIYLHRASWLGADFVYSPLFRTDEHAMDSISPLWTLNPSRPVAFSQAMTRPIEIQLYPPPLSSGTLELLTVMSADLTADQVSPTTILGIPDDFTPAIKYAALDDLLNTDGEAVNPFLAQYSQVRYASWVRTALSHRTVLRAQVNNRPVPLIDIYSLDTVRPFWHNTVGVPAIAAASYDVIAFSPVPNGLYGVSCDVAQSAPIPADDTDPIQIGPEEVKNIIEFALHYLQFKLGGLEFHTTFPQYDNFRRQAVQRNAILSNQTTYLTTLFGQAKWDQAKNPDLIESPASNPNVDVEVLTR